MTLSVVAKIAGVRFL